MVIPFAGSSRWYAGWLAGILAGLSDGDACAAASVLTPCHKESRRMSIPAGGTSRKPMLLSVPVAKGPGHILSDHGNWRHTHTGSLNAIYGRAPYFPYVFSRLSEVYEGTQRTLPELSRDMHEVITSWIDTEAAAQALEKLKESPGSALHDYCAEFATKVNYSFSILDPILRFGKDTVFVLLHELIQNADDCPEVK